MNSIPKTPTQLFADATHLVQPAYHTPSPRGIPAFLLVILLGSTDPFFVAFLASCFFQPTTFSDAVVRRYPRRCSKRRWHGSAWRVSVHTCPPPFTFPAHTQFTPTQDPPPHCPPTTHTFVATCPTTLPHRPHTATSSHTTPPPTHTPLHSPGYCLPHLDRWFCHITHTSHLGFYLPPTTTYYLFCSGFL